MMTKGKARGEVYSDLAIPPGETLSDEIAARGISQTALAARLRQPVQVVDEIMHGKKAITDHTAIGLEKVLGIPAAFWVNLEQNYQMTKASLDHATHTAHVEPGRTGGRSRDTAGCAGNAEGG